MLEVTHPSRPAGGKSGGEYRTVAETIAFALKRHGVTNIFAQSLPSAVILAAEDIGIRQLTYRTENAGAAMADGFARASGTVTVVAAQNGPAATLLVPALAEALKSSVPIVALVQDVETCFTDQNAFQEFDHFALFQSCAKWIRRLSKAERVEDYVDLAFTAACGGRPGPAVLLLPADVLLEKVTISAPRRANLGRFPLDRSLPDGKRIGEACDLLANAQHPLVIAGGGIHLSDAASELATLQDEAHLPVMTTVMGKGAVDERHRLSLGVGGNNMGRLSPVRDFKPLIEKSDVIVLVGTRTAQNGTDSWSLYPRSARFIHIDVDPSEIGRNYEGLRLVGDAKLTLRALAEGLKGRRKPDRSLEKEIAEARVRHAGEIEAFARSAMRPIRPERLMSDMQSLLSPDDIVVADASFSTNWVTCYLTSLRPGMRFITPRGLAGLGWGLPLALGAKLAKPAARVFSVVGDGGFAHVWSEMETAKRLGIPVVVTVLNNSILGYQWHGEDVKFGRHTTACQFDPVDHAAIARACGCRGERIEDPSDYLPTLQRAASADTLTLIDVVTDPAALPPLGMFDRRNTAAK